MAEIINLNSAITSYIIPVTQGGTGVSIPKGSSSKPVYLTSNGLEECEFTVAKSVPSNAVFTDTVTTVNVTGSGNGIANITSSGSTVTATKGTFLTAHQDISGKENSSNKVTSWSSTPTDAHYPSEKLVAGSFDEVTEGFELVQGRFSEYDTALAKVAKQLVYAGKCTTAGNVADKTVSVGEGFTLQWGAKVRIQFVNKNNTGSTRPTLNVNNTGAKIIMGVYGSTSPDHWDDNEILELMYVGDVWLESGFRSDKLTLAHFENGDLWSGWTIKSGTSVKWPAGGYKISDGMCYVYMSFTPTEAMSSSNPSRELNDNTVSPFPKPIHVSAALVCQSMSQPGANATAQVTEDGYVSMFYGGSTVPANVQCIISGFYPVDSTWLTNHGYNY